MVATVGVRFNGGTEEGMEPDDLLCSRNARSKTLPRSTRAVEDQSVSIPEERTSKLGGHLWLLAAALLDGLSEQPAKI